MEFEWDDDKRQTNLDKHDVDLLDAVLIFEGEVFTFEDERLDYGERRMISIGYADGQLYVLVHTDRGAARRLISARKGGRRDQRKYQAGLARGNSQDEGAG